MPDAPTAAAVGVAHWRARRHLIRLDLGRTSSMPAAPNLENGSLVLYTDKHILKQKCCT